MDAKSDLIKSAGAELVERQFDVTPDSLPLALAEAAAEMAKLANRMGPDDVSVDIDLPAGKMHFRCYRRPANDAAER